MHSTVDSPAWILTRFAGALKTMAEHDDRRQQMVDQDQYHVGRLLALSDGVFAIAMTLLVLGIPVPQLANPSDADLQAALRTVLPAVGSFALSFVLVGVYWIGHRRLLNGVVRTDARLTWLNLLMLLLVCIVPFTAALLSRYGNLATAVILYATNLALLGLLSLALRLQSWLLVSEPPSRREREGTIIISVVGIAVFAMSIPIALRSPDLAKYSWLLLLPVGAVFGRRLRNLGRSDPRR